MPCHSHKCTMIISVEVKEINMTRYPQEAVAKGLVAEYLFETD